MHITIGIPNLTGADFLKWLTEQLRAEQFVRMDLPRFTTADEQATALELLHSPPTEQGIEDLLWAVMMLPEFQIIR